MSVGTVTMEWHILQHDPDDLPEELEPVIVTVESVSGERKTFADILMKRDEHDNPVFFYEGVNLDKWQQLQPEEIMLWEPVIAWMYLPDPFTYY